ncbi:ribonuclease Y [Humisphaera borealis]|uniref:Ribonuclease Y n=1 Tax=Humisphaera borealis TaxID=2807512 RepID=A0A7M2WTD4_9BACT|nr:ribonuclease Y [Humisphaera borealis]QOV88785.1 ribonuclease Y [Humisphaera borealis]
MDYVIGILIGLIVGAAGVAAYLKFAGNSALQRAREEGEKLKAESVRDAQAKAKEIELNAKQEQIKLKQQFDRDHESARRKLEEHESRLNKREDVLDKKLDTLTSKERQLDDLERKVSNRDKALAIKEQDMEKVLKEQRDRLLQISGMSYDQAKELMLRRLEDECRAEAGEIITKITEETQEQAKDKSRQIILQAIQRYAAEQTADHTVSSVQIPSDDMKGRVIGREGRNIRAFEKTTGVDVIIDDTPGIVVVSCFDPVRREVARISLERLVQDGRIHPTRIEEIHAQASKEMEDELLKTGREAVQEVQLPGVNKGIIPMVGRLAYRTSYGQNVLRHSVEVAYLCQVIADELGLDGNLARRCGMFHDIGKAMDHEVEGGHPQIGMEFLRKFNEPEAVLNAALAHHGDVPATTPYTVIVMAADAISAARPGARRESLERYIKRLRELEDAAMTFDGVRQAYAIQAGREVRVIVDAKMIDDKGSAKVARDIAKKIENEMQYPGEIKVTVLRELRTVEYAR